MAIPFLGGRDGPSDSSLSWSQVAGLEDGVVLVGYRSTSGTTCLGVPDTPESRRVELFSVS